jgi:hypothetical protein
VAIDSGKGQLLVPWIKYDRKDRRVPEKVTLVEGPALLDVPGDRFPLPVGVHAHLVGREIADVSHGGFDGVVFAEKVAHGSRFDRTLHDD